MQRVLLLLSMAATFILGYFIMKKLDRFLDEWEVREPSMPEERSLRIGFSDPLVADSLTDLLREYAGKHPGVSVSLFSGTGETLCKKLAEHQLDVVFLPADVENPSRMRYDCSRILLACEPVCTKKGGLLIEPLTSDTVGQTVLWEKGHPTLYHK